MTKDARLTFRVDSDLKEQIETIAAKEGRSVAQVCVAFLKAGSDQYRREGSKSILKHLQRPE
jgi:antitoxin component of RelBE/YafQ-DinJ toxin-antitoxin module